MSRQFPATVYRTTRQDNAECAYPHFHYANELVLHDYETKIYLFVRKHPSESPGWALRKLRKYLSTLFVRLRWWLHAPEFTNPPARLHNLFIEIILPKSVRIMKQNVVLIDKVYDACVLVISVREVAPEASAKFLMKFAACYLSLEDVNMSWWTHDCIFDALSTHNESFVAQFRGNVSCRVGATKQNFWFETFSNSH